MKKLKGPLGLSLLAAALTAAALAAVSVAQDEDREALEGFRSCMEEQGAPAPPKPPEGNGGDVFERRIEPPSEEERARIEKAHEACKDELPEGVRHFGPGPGGPCGPPPGVRPGDGEGAAIPLPPPEESGAR